MQALFLAAACTVTDLRCMVWYTRERKVFIMVRGNRRGDTMEEDRISYEELGDAFTAVADADTKNACGTPY